MVAVRMPSYRERTKKQNKTWARFLSCIVHSCWSSIFTLCLPACWSYWNVSLFHTKKLLLILLGNNFRGTGSVRIITTAVFFPLVKVFVLHHHECVVPRQPVLAHKHQITWWWFTFLCFSASIWSTVVMRVRDRGWDMMEGRLLLYYTKARFLTCLQGSCDLRSHYVRSLVCLNWTFISSLMALSFLIRHIMGLKMRLFSASHALLNRHKQVSIQTSEVEKWV